MFTVIYFIAVHNTTFIQHFQSSSRCIKLYRQGHYLKQHRKGTYTTLLTEFTLQKHLHDIDEEARRMIEELTLRIVSVRGGNEELKASDPLRWVQEMRNAKAAAEEIVLREVVYR